MPVKFENKSFSLSSKAHLNAKLKMIRRKVVIWRNTVDNFWWQIKVKNSKTNICTQISHISAIWINLKFPVWRTTKYWLFSPLRPNKRFNFCYWPSKWSQQTVIFTFFFTTWYHLKMKMLKAYHKQSFIIGQLMFVFKKTFY